MALSATVISLICKRICIGLLALFVIVKGKDYLRDAAGSLQFPPLSSAQQLSDTVDTATSAVSSLSLTVSSRDSTVSSMDEKYVAICISVKDQNRDIREWIEYHEQLGVSQFYIVDHSSKNPLLPIVSDYIERGLVEYELLQQFRHPTNKAQPYVYDRCLAAYGHKHRFIGFIDADEFVVLKNTSHPDLPSFLRQFENYGSLAINWRLFGSSGHIKRPEGSTLQSYTRCNPEWASVNVHVKVFANTEFAVQSGGDPHHFVYVKDKYAVNEVFEPVRGALADSISMQHIFIQHYVIKSWEDFRDKQLRGSGMGNHRPAKFWDEIEAEATEDCLDLVNWRPHYFTRTKMIGW